MTRSISWTENKENQRQVLKLYRDIEKAPTADQIAEELGTTRQNVDYVLRMHLPPEERRALKKLRYALSKEGDKNPMKGKFGAAHHNWKGLCDDGYGYYTCLHNGKRQFVHRIVMAKMLGIDPEKLDPNLVIHHIDGDRKNNSPDNLALMTNTGHIKLHSLLRQEPESLRLKKSSVAELERYLISRYRKTKASE